MVLKFVVSKQDKVNGYPWVSTQVDSALGQKCSCNYMYYLITLEHIHTSQENFKRHFTHLLYRDKTIAKSKYCFLSRKKIEYIHRFKLLVEKYLKSTQ